MNDCSFRADFDNAVACLSRLYAALSDNLDASGVLTIQEYVLLENLLKEYAYYNI